MVSVAREVAFDFIADPRNALRWMHGFTRFDAVDPAVRGVGARVNAAGTFLGIPLSTTLEIVEFDRPRRLASQTTGRLKSRSAWELAPEAAGTRVTFTGEYDLPALLVKLVGDGLVQGELEKNAERSLAGLKHALEGVQ